MLTYACAAYAHKRCLEYDGPGNGPCACECHEAYPNCWRCNGTGSYPDDLPELVVCECVLRSRKQKSGGTIS